MSTLAILKNVGFTNSYEHVIDFENIEAQSNYFDSKIATKLYEDYNEFKFIRPNYELKVALPYNDLIDYNYCYFINTLKGMSKRFYAFITGIEYVNPATTKLFLQVDVMQTFMFDYRLLECYVDREHQDRFKKIGTKVVPVYNKQIENLEYGTDYKVVKADFLTDKATSHEKFNKYIYVFVASTEPLIDKPNEFFPYPSQIGLSTGVYIYMSIVRNGHDFDGAVFSTNPSTNNDYYMSLGDILDKFGDNPSIVSIQILPYCPFEFKTVEFINDSLGYKIIPKTAQRIYRNPDRLTDVMLEIEIANIMEQKRIINNLKPSNFYKLIPPSSIYREPDIDSEPKLKINPYFYFTLGNQQTTPMLIKNELLDNETNNIVYNASVGTINKERLYIENYNNDNLGFYNNIINTSNNELTLRTDAYKQYMSQNKASSIAGIALPVLTTLAGIMLAPFTAGTSAVASAGLIVGGLVSTATVIGNDIAKKVDLKQTPDTLRTSGNNIVFDYLAGNFWYNITSFEIEESAKERLFKYFMHYGYKASEFKVPNTKSRYYYNFIRLLDVNLESDLDQSTQEKIRDIYKNGVTFWHYRDKGPFIGIKNYNFENVEMTLME